MKRFLFFILFIFSFARIAEAQILTRFAVVDLNRVYLAYFSESRPIREFQERSARIQTEIDRMSAEIQSLRVNLVEARARGNNEQALTLEAEIARRDDFLREYVQVQRAALETQLTNLRSSSSFHEQIYDEINFIAESEGFSAVLNLTESSGIIWFSPTVDITDRLISSLRTRSR